MENLQVILNRNKREKKKKEEEEKKGKAIWEPGEWKNFNINIREKFKPSGQVNFTYSIYHKQFGSNTPIYRLDLHYCTCLIAKILKQNV